MNGLKIRFLAENAAIFLWHIISHPVIVMIENFKHKQLTLLAGVVVALIVIFTLWMRDPLKQPSGTSKAPIFSKIYKLKNQTQETLSGLSRSLLEIKIIPV